MKHKHEDDATTQLHKIYNELKRKYPDGLGMGSKTSDHLALEILALKRYLDAEAKSSDLGYIVDCFDLLMTILQECVPDAEPRQNMKIMQEQFQERFGIDKRG